MKKIPFLNLGLLLTNLFILFFITTGQKETDKKSETVVPILRAQMIELVDVKGQIRAQLKVEDDGSAIFRIKDAEGNIRVKLGANSEGSGLVLLDNKTEVGIHAITKSKGSTLTIANQDGKKQIIQP